jgi:ribonuclease J
MAQARLAEACQVQQAIVTKNGEMIRLAPGPAAVIGSVPVGRLVSEGKSLINAAGAALKNRQRMVFNGAALATIVMDRKGNLLTPPQVTVQGIIDIAGDTEELGSRVAQALAELSAKELRDDAAVREAARLAVRRSLKDWHGKKPVTQVHLVRLDGPGGRGAA